MPKGDEVYLGHMLDTAREAVKKVTGKSEEDYDKDDNLRLALTHLIQVIGEAARRVSTDFQVAHPEIPWDDIIGMRHKVVHDYMGVDFDIVWQVVRVDLPGLIHELERALPDRLTP